MFPIESELEAAFWQFNRENPQVYVLFSRFTFQLIKRGFKNYSADAVMHRIRWETNVETVGDKFKVNDHHVAFYSRLWMEVNPQHKGFFRTRKT